jgi:hypothetical protein
LDFNIAQIFLIWWGWGALGGLSSLATFMMRSLMYVHCLGMLFCNAHFFIDLQTTTKNWFIGFPYHIRIVGRNLGFAITLKFNYTFSGNRSR